MTESTLCSKLRFSCKCIELILACVCIGLYVHAPIYAKGSGQTPSGTLMTITFGGYVIVLLGLILGHACGEKVPKKTDLLYTLAGLCLFIAAGSVGINYYSHHGDLHKSDDVMSYGKKGLACSAIAIINGGVFLFDAMLSYKDVSESYTPH